MQPINNNYSTRNIERKLHEANQTISDAIAQTPEEVKELEAMLGSTPQEVPPELSDARAVLERIKARETARQQPSEFGKLISLLRTQKGLSIEKLADKTDLAPEELKEIESDPQCAASPMIVSELARFFKLNVQKTQQVAGLVKVTADGPAEESLGIAACAKPVFDSLSREEKKVFYAHVKRLKK